MYKASARGGTEEHNAAPLVSPVPWVLHPVRCSGTVPLPVFPLLSPASPSLLPLGLWGSTVSFLLADISS